MPRSTTSVLRAGRAIEDHTTERLPAEPPLEDAPTSILRPGPELWVYDPAQGKRVPLPAPSEGDSLLPDRVGPYRVLRELGRGGMGVVYLAHDEELDREVAVKLLHLGADHEDLARLRIEARALAQATHPNVVDIHGVFVDQGRTCLVLDVVDGPSLSQRLADGPLSSKQAARTALALASALAHIHRRGILHRDIKPSNVLLARDGSPVLTDFGLARDMGRSASGLTLTGAILGTPAYMSPEQALSHWDEVDARSDLYSLGATLYAMLTGRSPFQGALLSVLQAVVSDRPPAPSSLVPDVEPGLEEICLRAMSKRPADRYDSATDLAMALHAYLSGRPSSNRVLVVAESPTTEPVSLPSPPSRRQRSRSLSRRSLTASLSAVFALALGLPLAAVLSPSLDAVPADQRSGAVVSEALGNDLAQFGALLTRTGKPRGPAGADSPAAKDAPQAPVRKGGERQTPEGKAPTALPPRSVALDGEDLAQAELDGVEAWFALPEEAPPAAGPAAVAFVPTQGREAEAAPDEGARAEQDEEDRLDALEALGTGVAELDEPALDEPSDPVGAALVAYSRSPQAEAGYEPYADLVLAQRDAKGYMAANYFNDAATQRPQVIAAYGEAVLVGHANRVDWIVDGGIYGEAQLPAAVRSSAVADGEAFVATGDLSSTGLGDVYRRGKEGRWALSLDGNGAEAAVARLEGTVYAVLGGTSSTAASVHRFEEGAWTQVATLGQVTPSHVREFMGELWIVASPLVAGEGIHLYSGAGQRWVRSDRPLEGGKGPKDDERVLATDALVVRGNLFVATVSEDLVDQSQESEILVFDAERKKGKKKDDDDDDDDDLERTDQRFKKIAKLKDEAILCLAFQDRTLYAGTASGRLLYVDRKREKDGKLAKKFGTVFQEDESVGLNGGVSSLLPLGRGTLLVGLAGNAGTEILLRTPRPN